MYNTTFKGFIGRFCDSLPFSLVECLQGGAVICPINQVRVRKLGVKYKYACILAIFFWGSGKALIAMAIAYFTLFAQRSFSRLFGRLFFLLLFCMGNKVAYGHCNDIIILVITLSTHIKNLSKEACPQVLCLAKFDSARESWLLC